MTLNRFPPHFRADEIALITDFARRGLSSAFVGIAGIGKSNLLNCLRTQHRSLPAPTGEPLDLHYVVVIGNEWDGTPGGFWRLLRAEVEQTVGISSNVIPWGSEQAERHSQMLRGLLRDFSRQPDRRLVIVLDDVDKLLQRGPLDLLEQLRTLRDENRDILSYLLFSKRLPHRLGQGMNLRTDSKFYELFMNRIYALRPYNREDARAMLTYLNAQVAVPLTSSTLSSIVYLAGGHAMLLKLIHEIYLAEAPTGDVVVALARHSDIHDACRRILQSLHYHEQMVLHRLARHQPHDATDAPALTLLRTRGLLIGPRDEIFTPVFGQYLANLPALPA